MIEDYINKFNTLSKTYNISMRDFYIWCFILAHASHKKGFDWVYDQLMQIRGKADE